MVVTIARRLGPPDWARAAVAAVVWRKWRRFSMGQVLQKVDSLVGSYLIARCGVSYFTWPRKRLSTPAAVRPVVRSVRSMGHVGLPVRNISSMPWLRGLKKLAS